MKVMIIGAGKLGIKLAEAIIIEDGSVTVVDLNANVIEKVNDNFDVLTVNANGIDSKVLKGLGIEKYDLLVATTTNDETNTIICALAKKLGCKKCIARIRNPEHMKQMDFIKDEMGIDILINPDLETAEVIEKYLLKSYGFSTNDFAEGQVQMMDFNVENIKTFVNKKLKDIEEFKPLVITAISREGETIIPNGQTEIEVGDFLHVLGKSTDINEFSERFNWKRNREINKVMILGGGKIGFYLAKLLIEQKVTVVIIEKDKARCQILSEKLPEALIIYGDGTDTQLLEEENVENMDAFVAATGFDEQNLLMSLMAKQFGVAKSVAKISRSNYTKIIDRLDIDAAFNPIYITASKILKDIRGGRVIAVSMLLGSNAEVVELIVSAESPYINIPLKDLKLAKGVIIGAIMREREIEIPDGNSIIGEGDRVVVFYLKENLSALKLFFKSKKRVF